MLRGEWYTVGEVAKKLKKDVHTIYDWMKDPIDPFPTRTPKGQTHVMINEQEMNEWIERNWTCNF